MTDTPVPHVRGDEPLYRWDGTKYTALFPTCVGMNRSRSGVIRAVMAVPHVRGDEPLGNDNTLGNWNCSPRAWG